MKLIEIALGLALLIVSVIIGIAANRILSEQTKISVRQAMVDEELGRRQYEAGLLQAYMAASDDAGFDTSRQRRKLHAALDLYSLLVAEDVKFKMLSTSMPTITEDQMQQLIELRPHDRDAIQHIFARRNDAVRLLEAEGPFHIVLGAFSTSSEATKRLEEAIEALRTTGLRPFMNIVVNQDRLYLATLSSFPSRRSAEDEIGRTGLSKIFGSLYVSQSRGWQLWCRARFASCTGGQLVAVTSPPVGKHGGPVAASAAATAPANPSRAPPPGAVDASVRESFLPSMKMINLMRTAMNGENRNGELLLALHNRERVKLGLQPLVWDASLAAAAAAFAPTLVGLNRLSHSPPETRPGQGENLWMGTHDAYSIEDMVGGWASENAQFKPGIFPDVSKSGAWSDVGHYTQMVWPGTARVGCALERGAQWDFLICRYAPAGNVVGQRIP